MGEIIKATMESRPHRILNNTTEIDRMRVREIQKTERERLFVSLKKLPMPEVKPSLTRLKDSKCGKCRDASRKFSAFDDWYTEPVNVLEMKLSRSSWLSWFRFEAFKLKLMSMMDSLVIHPAQMKMIKNLQANNPEMPVVFVTKSDNPQLDLLLINFALFVNSAKLPLTAVDKQLRDIGGMMKEMNFVMLETGEKIKESQIEAHLQAHGNVLVTLQDLKSVLSVCKFGLSTQVFLMPVSINSEKIAKDFSLKLFNSDNFGIIKINFHEPYTIGDLVKTSDLANMTTQQETEKATKICKHLSYDIATKCPIMSTNVVAFLLLSEFRDGASVIQLADKLDQMRKKNVNIDFGFEGKAEDIVEHAIEILGKRLVEKKDGKFKPNVVNIVDLSVYAQVLMPHFAMESILIISAQSLKQFEGIVDYNELMSMAAKLCEILDCALNFIKPCEQIRDELSSAFDHSELVNKPAVEETTQNEVRARQIANNLDVDFGCSDDEEEEGYQSRDPSNEVTLNEEMAKEIESVRNVMMSILDTFITVVYALRHIKKKKIKASEKDLIRTSMRMMREEIEDQQCKYWESCSEQWIKSLIDHLMSLNLIEVDETSMVLIHSKVFQHESVKALFDMN